MQIYLDGPELSLETVCFIDMAKCTKLFVVQIWINIKNHIFHAYAHCAMRQEPHVALLSDCDMAIVFIGGCFQRTVFVKVF